MNWIAFQQFCTKKCRAFRNRCSDVRNVLKEKFRIFQQKTWHQQVLMFIFGLVLVLLNKLCLSHLPNCWNKVRNCARFFLGCHLNSNPCSYGTWVCSKLLQVAISLQNLVFFHYPLWTAPLAACLFTSDNCCLNNKISFDFARRSCSNPLQVSPSLQRVVSFRPPSPFLERIFCFLQNFSNWKDNFKVDTTKQV